MYILKYSKIRLSDPKYWEDKNDVEYIEAYRKKKRLKKVFAICFTKDIETIYHWSTVSELSNICYISFDKDKLVETIEGKSGYRHGEIKYLQVKELPSKLKKIADIPFCKRLPYANESEYRIIYDSKNYIKDKYLPIDLRIIKKITVGQKMSFDLYELLKNEIKTKYGLKVYKSTVYENKTWIDYINTIKK
jgi:hypothetical protein